MPTQLGDEPEPPAEQAEQDRGEATRVQARKTGGTPSSTATLMKKYGIPQRTETDPNASQADSSALS